MVKNIKAEFDLLADDYYRQHKENLAITGEAPEYFSKYKVADLAGYLKKEEVPSKILDFGVGIGNSIEHFREYFPNSKLYCSDVSARSMEISKSRFPGDEVYIKIENSIPVSNESFDVVFAACVFHHIPRDDHRKWISELKRVTRPGGVLVIYEHNPLNPLTIRAVNNCPIDVNAHLIRAGTMKQRLVSCGWREAKIEYKLFFPSALRSFRPLEKFLSRIFVGAQWRIIAKK